MNKIIGGVIVGYLIGRNGGNIVNRTIIIFSYYTMMCCVIRLIMYYYLTNYKTLGHQERHNIAEFIKCPEIHDMFNLQIDYEYNLLNNEIVVNRNFVTKVLVNQDEIASKTKKILHDFLFLDMFYHLQPIKIIFK